MVKQLKLVDLEERPQVCISGDHADFESVFTIVNVVVVDVNEEPVMNYPQQLTIGYPKRTFIDSAVSMPLFTFKVKLASTSTGNATESQSLLS